MRSEHAGIEILHGRKVIILVSATNLGRFFATTLISGSKRVVLAFLDLLLTFFCDDVILLQASCQITWAQKNSQGTLGY